MKKIVLAAVLSLGFAGTASATYMPVGAQTNVAVSTVLDGGWTQCYVSTMATQIGNSAQLVLNACTGDLLMMAGRVTGSSTLLVLAAALRADTIVDTGRTSITHVANGTNWYYSPNWSWGFTALGDTVSNNECDVSDSPVAMCLHTVAAGGYRINNITGLNGSTAYEKIFFTASSTPVPEPTSIALLGLGMLGLFAARKNKA